MSVRLIDRDGNRHTYFVVHLKYTHQQAEVLVLIALELSSSRFSQETKVGPTTSLLGDCTLTN